MQLRQPRPRKTRGACRLPRTVPSMDLAAELDAQDEDFAGKVDALLRSSPGSPFLCVGGPAGWEVVEFVPTGGAEKGSPPAGLSPPNTSTPARVPVLRASRSTLEEFFADVAFQAPESGYVPYRQERDRETTAVLAPFRERLTELENALVSEVRGVAAGTPDLAVSARQVCANCQGAREFTRTACWCVTLASASGGNYPDPGCRECEGSGVASSACPVCGGSGVAPVTLDVLVEGPGGDGFSFRMDIASLVQRGHAHVSAFTRLGAGGRFFEVVVRVDFSPLMGLVSRTVCGGSPVRVLWGPWKTWELGVEVRALSVAPDATSAEPTLTGVELARKPGSRRLEVMPGAVDLTRSARQALEALQEKAVAQAVNRSLRLGPGVVESLLDPDGSREGVRLAATSRVACSALLAGVVAAASASGGRIGLGQALVASGEVGVGVYLLSEGFTAVTLLAVSHSWGDALALALQRLNLDSRPG